MYDQLGMYKQEFVTTVLFDMHTCILLSRTYRWPPIDRGDFASRYEMRRDVR
jgi:hypothetical protein